MCILSVRGLVTADAPNTAKLESWGPSTGSAHEVSGIRARAISSDTNICMVFMVLPNDARAKQGHVKYDLSKERVHHRNRVDEDADNGLRRREGQC